MSALYGIWEFIVGDDWRVALGVLLALAATAGLDGVGLAAWWVCPLASVAILYLSVRRVAAAKREG
jgi:hypothetical protein